MFELPVLEVAAFGALRPIVREHAVRSRLTSNDRTRLSNAPVGRSNWIHIGSQHAGPRAAAIFSVVGSCRRLNIPVRDYLAAILPGLANAPIQRFSELTPAGWAARPPHYSTVGLL
jgi:hypothetical protein